MTAKTLTLTAAALLASLAAATATGSAQAPADPALVYSTGARGDTSGRDAELYVRDADGATRRITENRVFDGFPRWSPDRSKIAFVRTVGTDSDIYVMNADGTGARRLSGSARRAQDLYPAWSPDGRLIAFTSTRYGENEILVMRANGSGVRRVTRTARWVDDTQPTFAPDGRSLVISSNRLAFSNYELFRIRLSDGRVLKRLTFWGAGGDLTPGDDLMPEYSPDGRRIAWVSDRQGGYAVWTMNANGRDIRRVTRNPGLNVAFPRYSPDGARLVYSTFVFDDSGPREFALRVVPSRGGTPTVLGAGTEADW